MTATRDPPSPAALSSTSSPYRWRWIAFAVVLLASIMDLLDALVTNIAAPSIREDIGGGPALIQWLGAGYTLALAAGLITGGRLGDLYGRKPVFLIGAAGFTTSSLLCAGAVSPTMLIASRVAQGLFGAILLPQGLGVIKSVFPPKELATAFGAYGPAMGLASVGGPVLAGALIAGDILGTGWRMIFLINLPLGLFVLLAGARFIPGGQPRSALRLDVPGAGLAALAALLMIYPVVQGRERGWPAWAFVCIAVSLVLFVVFAKVESRTQRRGGDPLVVPSLFRKRAFSGGLVTGLAIFSALVGFSLVLTVYLQIGLGFSPLKAGLTVLPQAIGSVFGFVASGAGLAHKLGRRALHIGTILMMLGALGVSFATLAAGVDISPWQLAPVLLVYGAGLGLFLAPFFDIVLAGVEPHEYGSASGTLTAIQQFGSALGIAVLGTVFFGILVGQVSGVTASAASPLRAQLTAAQVPRLSQDRILSGMRACGRDRTVGADPAAIPATCRRLDADVRAAATSSTRPPAVAAAVQTLGTETARERFGTTLRQTIWAVIGLLVLAFTLAFLLPRHARPDVEQPTPEEPTPA